MTWSPPHPTDREPSWFERSSWAEHDWNAALEHYWTERARIGFPWRPDINAHRLSVELQALVDGDIHHARESYRRRVLGWYRKLCLPMQPGMCVPNRVAELMFEEWDVNDCPVGDAINDEVIS